MIFIRDYVMKVRCGRGELNENNLSSVFIACLMEMKISFLKKILIQWE